MYHITTGKPLPNPFAPIEPEKRFRFLVLLRNRDERQRAAAVCARYGVNLQDAIDASINVVNYLRSAQPVDLERGRGFCEFYGLDFDQVKAWSDADFIAGYERKRADALEAIAALDGPAAGRPERRKRFAGDTHAQEAF